MDNRLKQTRKVDIPISDATVANETGSTNGFIEPFILLFCPLKFCLEYQHIYTDSINVSLPQLKKAALLMTGL